MTETTNLSPLVSALPALLFVLAQIALGVAALAAVPRLGPERRTAALAGGGLVVAGGLLTGGFRLLLLFAPAIPVQTSLLGALGVVPPLVFAGGLLGLVLAATAKPAAPGPYPPPGTGPGAYPHPGR